VNTAETIRPADSATLPGIEPTPVVQTVLAKFFLAELTFDVDVFVPGETVELLTINFHGLPTPPIVRADVSETLVLDAISLEIVPDSINLLVELTCENFAVVVPFYFNIHLGFRRIGPGTIHRLRPGKDTGPGMNVEFVLYDGATILVGIEGSGLGPNPAVGSDMPAKVAKEAMTGVRTMIKRLAHFGIHFIPRTAKTAVEKTIERERRMTAMMAARPF